MKLFTSIDIRITVPKLLFLYKKHFEGDKDFGFHLTDLDTGIYLSRYDYGNIFKVQLLGFGIYIWWM